MEPTRRQRNSGLQPTAPLDWKELDDPRLKPDRYTIRNIFDRLRRRGDPWKDVGHHSQALPRHKVH